MMLAGLGHYAPLNRIDNFQLEQQFQLEAGWIERRTGIRTRRWVDENDSLIDLASKAGVAAITNAAISRHEIGLMILATSTPDHLLPPSAPLLAHQLELSHACAFDLSAACSGFLDALLMADGYVHTHKKAALIVAANILSRRLNLSDVNNAILFADAAGAIVVKPSTDAKQGILGMHFLSDGSQYDLISIPAGGSKQPFSPELPISDYQMKLQHGQTVFTKAVNMMTQCAQHAMTEAKLTSADIQYFIPHQANLRITSKTAHKLGIAPKNLVSIVHEYGNTSSAGIPLALSLAHQTKPFIAGDKILLTTAGAGMTAGAVVLGI